MSILGTCVTKKWLFEVFQTGIMIFLELLGLTRDGIAYQADLTEDSRTVTNVQNYQENIGFSALSFLAHCLYKVFIFFGDFSVKVAYLKVSSTLQVQTSSENFTIKKTMVFWHILYLLIFFLSVSFELLSKTIWTFVIFTLCFHILPNFGRQLPSVGYYSNAGDSALSPVQHITFLEPFGFSKRHL